MDDPDVRFRRSPWSFSLRYAFLSLAGFVALLPFLWMIASAFKTNAETMTRVSANPFNPLFWPSTPQWTNFVQVWRDDDFGHYFLNSFLLSGITLAGVLTTSLLAAYAFSKLRFLGRKFLFSLLLATLMIPETVTFIPNFVVISALGWVDTWQGMTAPFLTGAFYIFLLHQFIRQIPEPLFDSVKIDGASHLRTLLQLVVPLVRGPLFTVVFLDVLASWNSLQWPLLIAQTPAWRPLSVGLARFVSEAGAQTELRMAASLIALVPVVLLFVLAQKQITETLAQTGIRG